MVIQKPSYRYLNPGSTSPSNAEKITLYKKTKEFKDVSLDFEPHPITKDLTILRNERAIGHALKNLMLTIRGEVPFDYDQGSRIREHMFELVDLGTAQLIRLEIESVIKRFEPRIEILDYEDMFSSNIGRIRSQNQMDNEIKKPEYNGNVTFGDFYGDKMDSVGVKVTISEDENNFEVSIAYKIIGYEQVFVVSELLTPTR